MLFEFAFDFSGIGCLFVLVSLCLSALIAFCFWFGVGLDLMVS